MGSFDIFRHLYLFFSKKRVILFLCTGIIIALGFYYIGKIKLSEDIKSLLPDNRDDFLLEFNLLQKTPFMHKIIINLKDESFESREDLSNIADEFGKNILSSPFITSVMTGPVEDRNLDLYSFIIKSLPNLVNADDLEKIKTGLTDENIRELLTEKYSRLFAPEGALLVEDFRIDPLDLKTLILRKLNSLNILPEANLEDNHFIDRSGRNILLIADTNVEVTDTSNAEKMLAELNDIKEKIVPEDIDMYILSPQSYTVANAQAIKKDLFVVLSISSLSLIILFFLFLRNWRASFVLLISFASFAIALAGVSLLYATVSAITIGFGSVLLGLSDDLSLHVYFALRKKDQRHETSAIMSEVSRPVLYGGLIIICSLSLLLFSDLPGQRQLGAFSIIGVIVSLALTLILLPQMMQASSLKTTRNNSIVLIRARANRPMLTMCLWVVLLAVCLWSGRQISFDGDLNKLNYKSGQLLNVESHIKKTWGDLQSRAMIFSEGEDLESALIVNERLFQYLLESTGDRSIISVAPVMPSITSQKKNIAAWKSFWAENLATAKYLLKNEGKKIGFTDDAFDPFIRSLDAASELITPEALRNTGITELLDSLIISDNDRIRILTLAPDTDEITALLKDPDCPDGVRFVSQGFIGDMIRKTVGYDFTRFIIGALLVILLLLIPLFRDVKKVMLSMVPVVTGLIFMLGIMSFFNIAFNIFNVISSILIIGLGIDYGIFMVYRCSEKYEHDTDTAVLLSGLTTITGFGALVFAQHPALYSIGVTVLLGIGAAIPASIYVIPALYRIFEGGSNKTA